MSDSDFASALGSMPKLAFDASCFTCFSPALDQDPNKAPTVKNMFASVGFSDASLGRKQAAWRLSVAAEPGVPDTPSPPPGDLDADLARLLADDEGEDQEVGLSGLSRGGARCTSADGAGNNPFSVRGGSRLDLDDASPMAAAGPDDLHLLPTSLVGDDNTCTTCWNLHAAMAERKVRRDYSLPETAMALGSSKIMSSEERAFVDRLMSGKSEDATVAALSEEAAIAARLGGLPFPADSSVTPPQADFATELRSSASPHGEAGGSVSVASADVPAARASKRLASDMDATSTMDSMHMYGAAMVSRFDAAQPSSQLADASATTNAAVSGKRARRATAVPSSSSHHNLTAVSVPSHFEVPTSAFVNASSPTGSAGSAAGSQRHQSRSSSAAKGRQLPEWSVHILKEWLLSQEHFDYPWPTPEEKTELAARAGIDERQLGIWLTNARKRLWMPLRRRQGLPIPRYADAKAERVQKALVARVEREARKVSPASSQSHVVDPVGAARVNAALHAAQAQLRAEAASLDAEAAAVEHRAAMLEQALAGPGPAMPLSYGRMTTPQLAPMPAMQPAFPPALMGPTDYDVNFGLPDDDDFALGLA
ncbi:hypothetical protein FNF31_05618 [Cafeteria roenbergensis]|uniref:Homeobox domain-containing protein n=1 Tax=Cafeteria roenbergensis TaxID=33653 RepID=A0A5A8CZ34_CAFRO|nr:hypothetical protein FNF31_05618 [Cafeteria roenbergensis]